MASSAGSLPAYLPTLTVRSLAPTSPAKATAVRSLQLTPSGCSGNSCTGFRVSNTADYSSRTNVAVFTPAGKEAMVDPFNPKTYELGTLELTNGGFAQPADGGSTLVPITASLHVSTQGSGKATTLSVPFAVYWSPGSPAAPNNAGLFVLATKASSTTPAPTQQFKVGMTTGIDFNMQLDVLGFVPDPSKGKDVTVMGDWGQQTPKSGEPGPRVYVKQGAGPQLVKLIGRISKLAD